MRELPRVENVVVVDVDVAYGTGGDGGTCANFLHKPRAVSIYMLEESTLR